MRPARRLTAWLCVDAGRHRLQFRRIGSHHWVLTEVRGRRWFAAADAVAESAGAAGRSDRGSDHRARHARRRCGAGDAAADRQPSARAGACGHRPGNRCIDRWRCRGRRTDHGSSPSAQRFPPLNRRRKSTRLPTATGPHSPSAPSRPHSGWGRSSSTCRPARSSRSLGPGSSSRARGWRDLVDVGGDHAAGGMRVRLDRHRRDRHLRAAAVPVRLGAGLGDRDLPDGVPRHPGGRRADLGLVPPSAGLRSALLAAAVYRWPVCCSGWCCGLPDSQALDRSPLATLR